MKEKTVVAIAVIIVVGAILVSAAFVWQAQEQLNELRRRQTEIAEGVKIVDFSSSGWWNPVGVTVVADFNVTVANSGSYDAEGLIVVIEGLDFQDSPNNVTGIIDSLPAGEATTVEGTISFGFNAWVEGSRSLLASVWANGEVVDTRVINLRET